jgi:hypothetical protein
MRNFVLIQILVLVVVLLGCNSKYSYEATEAEVSHPPVKSPAQSEKLNPAKHNGEFVSGAIVMQETPYRKYKVISSAGSHNKEIVAKTLNGYKVYYSGSGILFNPANSKTK